MILDLVSYALISLGMVILVTASFALYRFPDIYMRLHASSKASTGGTLTLLLGLLLRGVTIAEGGKIVLVIALILATGPITAHAIARAAHVRGYSGVTLQPTENNTSDGGEEPR